MPGLQQSPVLLPTDLSAMGLGTRLVFGVGVVALYALGWHASSLFEVRHNVSAAFLLTGLTMSLHLLFGWRMAPLCLVAYLLIPWYQWPVDAARGLAWLDSMRHVLLYGAPGLYLHRRWRGSQFARIDMAMASQFLWVSLVAGCLNAWVVFFGLPLNPTHAPVTPQLLLSFWGGDLVGIMVVVPLAVVSKHLYDRANGDPNARRHGLQRLLGRALPGTAISLWALASVLVFVVLDRISQLPASEFSLLILLPVLMASLARGLLAGLCMATLVCGLMLLTVRTQLAPDMALFNLQMLLLLSTITAMLAGASHDDNVHQWHRANHDRLTGLANRGRFMDQLDLETKRARRSGKPIALMYLDLDRFKPINDTLGHPAGDEVLVQVAQRLRANTRETDLVARLGGDEFAVLLSELSDLAVVERIGQTLLQSLAQPYVLSKGQVELGVSIGAAYFPSDAQDGDQLCHRADQALYEAKHHGRGQLVQFGRLRTPATEPLTSAQAT